MKSLCLYHPLDFFLYIRFPNLSFFFIQKSIFTESFSCKYAIIFYYSFLIISNPTFISTVLPNISISIYAILLCRSILQIFPSIPIRGPARICTLSFSIMPEDISTSCLSVAYFHKQIYFFLNQWDDLIAGSDQLRQSDDFPESIYQFFRILGN